MFHNGLFMRAQRARMISKNRNCAGQDGHKLKKCYLGFQDRMLPSKSEKATWTLINLSVRIAEVCPYEISPVLRCSLCWGPTHELLPPGAGRLISLSHSFFIHKLEIWIPLPSPLTIMCDGTCKNISFRNMWWYWLLLCFGVYVCLKLQDFSTLDGEFFPMEFQYHMYNRKSYSFS